MTALTSLLDILIATRPAQEFNGQSNMWAWAGPTPESVEPTQALAAAIIGVGAPLAAEMLALDRADAEVWLSLFARRSLCHGVEKPNSNELQGRIGAGFNELGPDARFYSNGYWTVSVGRGLPEIMRSGTARPGRRQHHLHWHTEYLSRIPNALTDGGIIGVGTSQSFLFWVCEDD